MKILKIKNVKYFSFIEKNKYLMAFLLLLFTQFSSSLKAQQNHFGCGTVLSETQIEYMNATRQERNEIDLSLQRNGPVTIPIAVHRILDSANDVEAISTAEVSQIIADANMLFQQADMSFSYCFDEEIDNGDYNCLINRSSHEYNMTSNYFLDGAINVYFIPDLCVGQFQSGEPNAWASFPGQRYVENSNEWCMW